MLQLVDLQLSGLDCLELACQLGLERPSEVVDAAHCVPLGVMVVVSYACAEVSCACDICQGFCYTGECSMRRSRMSRGESKFVFRQGAERVHPRNSLQGRPMRGGIRL